MVSVVFLHSPQYTVLLDIMFVQVELDIDVKAVLYDTKQSFYNCNFSNGECTFNAMSLVGNSVVVTSPAASQVCIRKTKHQQRYYYDS